MELLIFGLFAFLALLGAVGVVLSRNPVHSAVCLLLTLFAVAALFATLWAEFIAVVQLLVYAGGIMVLFLFVIMLVDLERRGLDAELGRIAAKPSRLQRWLYALAALVLSGGLGLMLSRAGRRPLPSGEAVRAALQSSGHGAVIGNVERLGDLLYTSYLLPFELASVLLLVAMIGAAVIARQHAE